MTELMLRSQVCMREIWRAYTDEEGQDMVEYALLAALISIVAIAIIVLVGPALKNMFGDVVNGLNAA